MTRTFAVAEQGRQRGVTLFELLIALALVALLATIAIGGVRASSPHLHVKLTAEQLLADLKRAREEAVATGAPAHFTFYAGHYAVDTLDLERALPSGVRIVIDGVAVDANDPREISLDAGFAPRGHRIVIRKSTQEAEITIDPITRRTSLR